MSCYLCGSNSSFKRDGNVRDNPNLDILECSSCGLVYLSTKDHISDDFYKDSGMSADLDIASWLKQTCVDDSRRFEFLKEMIADKKILDFGSGVGGFLMQAKQHASYACGVELEKRLKNHYMENSIDIFNDLDILEDDYFDVVTAFHVIEHLPDPAMILQKLFSKLKVGGKMIIEVPNSNDALLSIYKNKPFANFTYWSPHLFLYNSKTLGMLFKKAGLDVAVKFIKYIQRYPLSNHLYWLSNGKPGGHQEWGNFLDFPSLCKEYEASLASIGATDTLIALLRK